MAGGRSQGCLGFDLRMIPSHSFCPKPQKKMVWGLPVLDRRIAIGVRVNHVSEKAKQNTWSAWSQTSWTWRAVFISIPNPTLVTNLSSSCNTTSRSISVILKNAPRKAPVRLPGCFASDYKLCFRVLRPDLPKPCSVSFPRQWFSSPWKFKTNTATNTQPCDTGEERQSAHHSSPASLFFRETIQSAGCYILYRGHP